MVTLAKYKENLAFEINEIEKKLDRGIATTEEKQRLQDIYTRLNNISKVEKPDSMAKQAKLKMEGSQ